MIELRAHQKLAVEKARINMHLAIFHAMGTGKSATLVRILAEEYNRRKGVVSTLIFAPLTVTAQWPDEFAKFSGIPPEKIMVLVGPGKKRTEKLLKQIEKDPSIIVITNYESVGIKEFHAALLKWSPKIMAADEAHRLKDSTSKRAKAIYPLAMTAERRFILTGTPIVNSLLDVFGMYKFMNPSIFGGGFWTFRTHYFYDRNVGKQFSYPDWVMQPHAAQEIGEKMARTSCQAKLEDVVDMPPLTVIPVPVEMTTEQEKVYRDLKREYVTELRGAVMSAEFAMTASLRLQQILAGFILPDETHEPLWFKDQPRLDALMDLIDGIGKERVIIWCTFKPNYRAISTRLTAAKIPHGFLTGEQSQKEKQEYIEAFKAGTIQAVIANPAAASEGINLQEAKYAIYFMRSWNLAHALQSAARNYRSGTEKLHSSVIHYHLFTKGTLDEVVMRALNAKENLGKTVLNWAKESS